MGDPVGWRGVTYGSPVLAADGTKVGVVQEILGSDAEDIFHGVRVRLGRQHGGRDVQIGPDDIASLTTDGVMTELSPAEIGALPGFDETATYHLASVGWLRKHLGWAKDSSRDEEAG
jgi:hypothetical protein